MMRRAGPSSCKGLHFIAIPALAACPGGQVATTDDGSEWAAAPVLDHLRRVVSSR